MRKVLVIVGQTSSGKTKLAVDLARKFNGEIVSADSRQVYRGMDIGTGKELRAYGKGHSAVRHHLIDVVSPRMTFTLDQYQKRAYRAIEDILRRGKLPILVGGTGLYVSAVVDGYVLPEAPPDAKLRARLAKWSFLKLRVKLKKLDPETYRTIDKHNRRRLERAIEIILQTGRPLSAQRVKRAPPYDVLMLGLAVSKAELHRRIDKRLKERLKQGMAPPFAKGGMVEEVKRLHKQGVSWKRLESFGLEYRYISRYLQEVKKIDRAKSYDRTTWREVEQEIQGEQKVHEKIYDEMVRQLSAAIKDFARRQMTWFKRDKRIAWVKTRQIFAARKFQSGKLKKRPSAYLSNFLSSF